MRSHIAVTYSSYSILTSARDFFWLNHWFRQTSTPLFTLFGGDFWDKKAHRHVRSRVLNYLHYKFHRNHSAFKTWKGSTQSDRRNYFRIYNIRLAVLLLLSEATLFIFLLQRKHEGDFVVYVLGHSLIYTVFSVLHNRSLITNYTTLHFLHIHIYFYNNNCSTKTISQKTRNNPRESAMMDYCRLFP